MGLKVTYTMICDGCGKKVVVERTPEKNVEDDYFDEWGAGIPDGWLELVEDEITGQKYLFFHNEKCYIKWLKRQGRNDEAKKFLESPSIA